MHVRVVAATRPLRRTSPRSAAKITDARPSKLACALYLHADSAAGQKKHSGHARMHRRAQIRLTSAREGEPLQLVRQ